jgi:hypothetical protein
VQFMEQKQKLAGQKKGSEREEESQYLTPKIRQSRVELAGKRRQNAVDASTIRRREALGRMLAESKANTT